MTDPAFEKRIYHLFMLSTILAIIGIILMGPLWPKNPYAAILWPMISVPIFLTSAIGAFRMQRAKTPEEKATYAIQHSWWILSLGFSGLLLFPAPFFREAGGANAIVMTIFSILWIIFGIIGIYEPHAETGVPITV